MGTVEEMDALSIMGQPEVRITRDKSNCFAAQINASHRQVKDSNCAEITEAQVQLPEDILHQIHALMPMQDAAQAACVSTEFLRSWRSYSKLVLSVDSLGIKEDTTKKDETQQDFISRVEHIMQNHSGKGVKKFSLQTYPCSNLDHSSIDRWLQIAATPGIEELELLMF
ncbi:hypothetical protein PR202_ga22301 [Eleusine coracana subsp. coracana]|uniref:F-box domain-containing protein n=1 Tax=Eleusine coracana subsp. coracana TaxID=191504 RepID=A0AAV5D375_ELECO|nr:hypothetical protein PR202_ga22301 [Eleusine coracana subsp. coracana]